MLELLNTNVFFLIVLYEKFSKKWMTNRMTQTAHNHQGDATLCLFVFTPGTEFQSIIFFMHLLLTLMHCQTVLNHLLNQNNKLH
jgi:hypothetical protein